MARVAHGKQALILIFTLGVCVSMNQVWGFSEADYPDKWAKWPILAEGIITPKNVPVPKGVKDVKKEFFKVYSWLNKGKGEKYRIRQRPNSTVKTGEGIEYKDGPNLVLELMDSKMIFVTEHISNDPLYGIFTNKGDDLEGEAKTLKLEFCEACHSWYKDACVAGVCSDL